MRLRISCLLLAMCALPAHAQWRIQGVGPDLQVAGGVGFGLDDKLDNAFLGRLRLGALYAFEPYWVDAGLTLEVGALAELAIGGELEWNEFHGWFANAGFKYAKQERIVGHVSVGYTIFGLEFQHAFEGRQPHDALLFIVRFPLGFWWFTSGRDERPFAPPPDSANVTPAPVQMAPRPLGPARSGAAAPAAMTESQRRASDALGEAALAGARQDHAAVSDALRRAYAAQPDPLLWIRIADADAARGELALSAQDLQRFLGSVDTAGTPEALAQRPAAEARLRELLAQVARLRLTLEAATGGEQIELDGAPQPEAALGYDVLLDPGQHQLSVRRGGETIATREIQASAGELIRLTLPLPAASPAR